MLPEPVIFMKATSAIGGPFDDVEIPRGPEETDWEVELGVVIGTAAKYVEEGDALAHVAGYCIVNGVSGRVFQTKRHGRWTKGKNHDTLGHLGPWLVTRDEIADPHDLAMWLEVDGHRYQDGSTRTMVYQVPFPVSYLSQFMSLQPGDVISTGTPPGVGLGQKPPVFLKPDPASRHGAATLGPARRLISASRRAGARPHRAAATGRGGPGRPGPGRARSPRSAGSAARCCRRAAPLPEPR